MAEHPNPYDVPHERGDDLGGCRGAIHAFLVMALVVAVVLLLRGC